MCVAQVVRGGVSIRRFRKMSRRPWIIQHLVYIHSEVRVVYRLQKQQLYIKTGQDKIGVEVILRIISTEAIRLW